VVIELTSSSSKTGSRWKAEQYGDVGQSCKICIVDFQAAHGSYKSATQLQRLAIQLRKYSGPLSPIS
jgi:hypothetical protein